MSGTVSKLTLGTATLGSAYGVANPRSEIAEADAWSILDHAWQAGMTSLDTAPGYGIAERRIGDWTRARRVTPTIATKLPALGGVSDNRVEKTIQAHLEASLERLGAARIEFYLTHDAGDYLRPPVRRCLNALASEGRIGSSGPSVYEPDEVFAALDAGPPGVLQLPLSALDQRMITARALEACSRAGVTVFARSIMLQGLIFLAPDKMPEALRAHAGPVAAFRELAASDGISPAELALRFASGVSGISSIIVGCYSLEQLNEILATPPGERLSPVTCKSIDEIANNATPQLLDPRTWTR